MYEKLYDFPISFYLRLESWLCGIQKEVIVVEHLSHLPPARTGSENMEDCDPDYQLLTLISLSL